MALNKWLLALALVILTVSIDQLAKLWILDNVAYLETRPIIASWQPYLQITRTINTGIAFGLAIGGNTVVLILSVVITLGLLWMLKSAQAPERLQQIALALVIGGAVGNIIDRVRLGHVVDFVHITIPGIISNVSNFADHFVVIGVGLLLLDSFINPQISTDEPQTADETRVSKIS
ncbi:MAG: signal peptidase II [Anaerolineae bacterium]